jgi:hypothetical protein
MSDESNLHATPPAIDLIDFLEAVGREVERRERAELAAVGRRGILEDLEMELRAVCAERGIDWTDILAAATRRVLHPDLRHWQ